MQLVTINNGQAVTTSEVIAANTENQHRNVLELIDNYKAQLGEFGVLRFETAKLSGAGRPGNIALLNEQQATFLLTLMRNSEVVVRFKLALVKAFFELRDKKRVGNLSIGQMHYVRFLIRERSHSKTERQNYVRRLSEKFGVKKLSQIVASYDDVRAATHEMFDRPAALPDKTSNRQQIHQPSLFDLTAFDGVKRYFLWKDGDRIVMREMKLDEFAITPGELAKYIADPGGLIPRSAIPEIIRAAASRLQN